MGQQAHWRAAIAPPVKTGQSQRQNAQKPSQLAFATCSFNVALRPRRPYALFGKRSPGRPPRL